MKTAISLPDSTFERVKQEASAAGMSRSEFFARAAERYADELDATSLTAAINDALAQTAADDALVVEAGHRVLARIDDEW